MKEEKRITQADIDEAEVRLGPIAGIQPRVYLPLAYALALALLLFLVLVLPGIKRYGSYIVLSGAPDKAALYVGDEYRGCGQAGIYLKAGTYALRIEHEGFAPATIEAKVGGRLIGSLFFPRRQKLDYSLKAIDPKLYLASALSAYAGWSLAGKPSALYQIPTVLSDAAIALASTGALNQAFPGSGDKLAFMGDAMAATSSAEAGRDGLKAATLAAASGLPGPLTLAAAARTFIAATGAKPAAAVMLNDILPKSANPARKMVADKAAQAGQKPKAQSGPAPRRVGTQSFAGLSFSMFSPGAILLSGEAPSGSFAPFVVELPEFGLASTETTVGQWKLFLSARPEWKAENLASLQARGLVDESYMDGFSLLSDGQPVTGISWHAAKAYCDWLNSRSGGAYAASLPTEAMWEAAAWLQNSTKNAVWSDSSPKGSQNVASFGYAASSGLADLFGNVWEWTADSYYPYPALSGGYSGHGEKAVRGGSWANEAAGMGLEKRGGVGADHGSAFLGFRPAILRK